MMTNTFQWVLNKSLSSVWLILALILLRPLLGKVSKRMRCLLWALVALRLLCPFTLESALSLLPTREVFPESLLYDQTPTIETGIPVIDQAIAPAVSNSLTPHPGASVNPIQVYLGLGAILWCGGMVVLTVYTGWSYFRLHRRVAASLPMGQRVYLCDHIDTPFILGIFRPRIYLPSALPEEERRYVLAHEQAHLLRRDHLWKPLGFALTILHWFNPFCWLAYSLFCKDIELACDEQVVGSMIAETRKAYSQALLSCSTSIYKIVACPLAFGEVGVKERIRAVLTYRKPAFRLVVLAVLACMAAAVFFMTDPLAVPDESSVVDQSYEALQNIYASPPLVESDYEVQYLPQFHITADHQLQVREEGEWNTFGVLDEWQLNRKTFDRLFTAPKSKVNGPWTWPEEEGWFRRQNYKAWRVVNGGDFYLLLLQRDGKLLLTNGYYDAEGETDPASDDSSVRWMVLLAPMKAESSMQAESEVLYWAYQPYLSSKYPAFPFYFEQPFDSLELSGPNGTRQMIVGGIVGGDNKVFADGNGFCWSPMNEGEDAEKVLMALTSEVTISVKDPAGKICRGTVYIAADIDPTREAADTRYTIWLESDELIMRADPERGGAVISLK